MDFLCHWDWYDLKVGAITAESHPIWSFHHVASRVLIFLDDGPRVSCSWFYLISAHIGQGIVVVVTCFGC